jgi:hypothetical protein
VLWRAGSDAEAAALLAGQSGEQDEADFAGPFARAFAQAQRERSADQLARACAELDAKLDPLRVRALIRTAGLGAEPALRCHEQLKRHADLRAADAAHGYALVRAWKGEDEARAWLDQALPSPERTALAAPAHALELDDAIWELVADPKPDEPEAPLIWLLRSAAFTRSAAPREDRRQRLEQYYATHREALRDLLGLHLLGRVDQDSVWAAVASEQDLTECTYVFALKAQLDGDVAQAADWYRHTVARGRGGSAALQWASVALGALRASHASLGLLSAEAKERKAAREATPLDPRAGTEPKLAAPDAGTTARR